MNFLTGLITAIILPITILNLLGGIVSGIWLIILREWPALISGIVALFCSHFILSIVMIPSLIFMLPVLFFTKRKSKIGLFITGFFSQLFIIVLMVVWCSFALQYFVNNMLKANALIPVLIWSYGVALSPWMFLAYKDQQAGAGNPFSIITILFAQIAYIVSIVFIALGDTGEKTAGVFLLVMGICFLVNIIFFGIVTKTETFN